MLPLVCVAKLTFITPSQTLSRFFWSTLNVRPYRSDNTRLLTGSSSFSRSVHAQLMSATAKFFLMPIAPVSPMPAYVPVWSTLEVKLIGVTTSTVVLACALPANPYTLRKGRTQSSARRLPV